jgi:hypothetical protein
MSIAVDPAEGLKKFAFIFPQAWDFMYDVQCQMYDVDDI